MSNREKFNDEPTHPEISKTNSKISSLNKFMAYAIPLPEEKFSLRLKSPSVLSRQLPTEYSLNNGLFR